MRLEAAYSCCRDLVRQSGSSFYHGMRLLPRSKRQAMYTIYAWSRLADDAVDLGEHDVPESALDDIAQLLDRALASGYVDDPHPIAVALGDTIRKYQLPEECFRNLLDGMLMDLHPQPFATFDDLLGYCRKAAGTVGQLCLEIFGYHDDEARDLAIDLGIAMQLTNILRDLGEDLDRGRVYLPVEDVERFGYSLEALSRRQHSDAFRSLMAEETMRAKAYYERASRLLGLVDRDARLSLAMLYHVYHRLLQRIEREDYDVFSQRIRVSTREKLWMAISLFWHRQKGPAEADKVLAKLPR